MAKSFVFKKAGFLGVMQQVIALVDRLDPAKKYELQIKQYSGKRSLDANAYCWLLLGKLAAKHRKKKTELYQDFIKEIGGNGLVGTFSRAQAEEMKKAWEQNGLGWMADIIETPMDASVTLILYKGSSAYDARQMNRLIDLIVQECEQVGIETATPAEIKRMMEDWHAQENKAACNTPES